MPTQKRNTKKKSVSKGIVHDNIYGIIPLLLIVGIIPLIIYIKPITLNAVEVMYAGGNDTRVDIFSYCKMVYLLLFSTVGLLAFLFRPGNNPFDKQRKAYYIPLSIYSFFVVLSALAAEYKAVAFWGFLERYEGAFVLIAYVVVMFLAMNVLKEEKYMKILFICLLASSFIISILGALQLFGIDYFKWGFVNDLITPKVLKSGGGMLQAAMSPKTVFSTLYNPNYVGSYMAMLMPVILIFLIWAKKVSHKLILVALLCPVAISWIGCDSRAGIVGGLFSFIIILIMSRKKILQHKIIAISIAILLCGGLVVMNYVTEGSVINGIQSIASLQSERTAVENRKALDKALQGLLDVSMDSERMKIVTDKGTLQIILLGNVLSIKDENNKQVENSIKDNIFSFTDTRFQNIKLATKPEEGSIEIYYNDYHLIDIILTREGLKSNSNMWLTYRNNKSIEAFGFDGNETFASGRGYIWSRTIPLLKDTILLGHGPDTFPIYFPQYDYIGKLKMGNVGGIFVNKAHNIYLQTAINTGVVSLLALLTLFGMYFVSSIKIYIKEEFTTFLPIAGLACFAAFCGYSVAGIFNDSVVSVAPVFWVLLGLGIGINVMLKEKLLVSTKVK